MIRRIVLTALAVSLLLTGCTEDPVAAPGVRADPEPGAGLMPDAAALSPDGGRLVVPCPDALCVWSTADGSLTDTWAGGSVVAWAPQGDLLATSEVTDGVASVVLLDAADGAEVRRMAGPEVEDTTDTTIGGITDVAFSADGETVAAASGDGTVRVWSVDGEPVATLDVTSPLPDALAFDPAGERLAVAGTEAPVEVFEVGDEALVGTLDAEPQGDVAWSPDGATLATGTREAGPDSEVRLWSAADLAETDARRAQGDQLAFAPDSDALAFSQKDDPTVIVWPMTGPDRVLTGATTPPRAVLWSPSGEVLHAVAADGIRGWEVASGEVTVELEVGARPGGSAER